MKKFFLYLSIAAFFLVFSCKKDENKEITPDYLLQISVDPNNTTMFDYVSGVYVWLTSSNGEIIADTILTLGSQINIERPEGFTDERFSYHVLTYMNNDTYRIKTYAMIKGGKINYKNTFFIIGKSTGEIELDFTDVPEFDYFLLDDGEYNRSGSGLPNLIENVYENVDWFYLSLWNQNSLYYKFIDNIKPGTKRTISLADMETNFEEYNIGFDKSGYIYTHAYAYDEVNFSGRKIDLRSVNKYLTTPSHSILIPKGVDRFKSLSYHISFIPDNQRKIYGFSSYGNIPAAMEYINADLETTNFDLENYEINATGEFDNVSFAFDCFTNHKSFVWTIYDKLGKNIVFPALPKRIKTLHPNVCKEDIINANSHCSINLIESDNISGYDETIDALLNRSGKQWFDETRKSKIISLYLSFNGEKTQRTEVLNEMANYFSR